MGILKDIQSGALPAKELPSFLWWMVRGAFWPLFVLIVIGGVLLLVK